MKVFSEMQDKKPCSVRLWPEQLAELDRACSALGVSRSRLLRHGALVAAAEVLAGAERPKRLHR